ncbi:putative bifunctional diguanylate cyclase/phosphodiesterase [Paenibacillus naphthalenovorans]|uniref:putative bifunctional diguanylate cyclase/phosphodiesterase n=1 Tax=Paenibacillus naphthalenovorans TaxID=162209 RepID=UPI00088CAC4D|nr:EAL domain-containing protein [Paenibacillus naphthalenovorans]SDJ02851.1 diguanylate cyclase (GGDEF) domain-containing protein [Paenibacillus naphthalenovorans]
MNRHKLRSPAGASGTSRPWQGDGFLQHASFLRLWFTLIGTQAGLFSIKGVLGLPYDQADWVAPGFILIAAGPVLYLSLKKKANQLRAAWYAALTLLLLAECAEMATRYIYAGWNGWLVHLADAAGTMLLAVPLLYFVIADLRNREATERRLHDLSFHDQLTGLPNREKFQQSLEASIEATRIARSTLAVLFINLDRFKNINDTFGHTFGDRLLMEAAERLKNGLNSGASVSRQEGDKFTVTIEEAEPSSDVELAAQKIVHLFSKPFSIDGHELRVGCSIGIARYPQDGDDPITLMKNAATAMSRAKDYGTNGYRFYTAEMNDAVIQKLVLEEWMNKALEQDEFVLYFQPQVDIFDHRLNGMEALLRWNHPRLGVISPGDFIPLAEETGLIIPIGKWVLRTACMQNKAWQLEGFPPLKMAVNISPVQFYQDDFVQVVLEALQESGLEPQYLELEITEGIAMYQLDQVVDKLNTLRELGVHISIDDFGTGFSSLNYLKKFPIDKLKIAQQFVRDVTDDPDDAAIVQAIMAMAQSLNLNVIAEGVETEDQLSFLLEVKCREIQGYIYSKPVPADEFYDLLKRNMVA